MTHVLSIGYERISGIGVVDGGFVISGTKCRIIAIFIPPIVLYMNQSTFLQNKKKRPDTCFSQHCVHVAKQACSLDGEKLLYSCIFSDACSLVLTNHILMHSNIY